MPDVDQTLVDQICGAVNRLSPAQVTQIRSALHRYSPPLHVGQRVIVRTEGRRFDGVTGVIQKVNQQTVSVKMDQGGILKARKTLVEVVES